MKRGGLVEENCDGEGGREISKHGFVKLSPPCPGDKNQAVWEEIK